jgi:hypothetical protein
MAGRNLVRGQSEKAVPLQIRLVDRGWPGRKRTSKKNVEKECRASDPAKLAPAGSDWSIRLPAVARPDFSRHGLEEPLTSNPQARTKLPDRTIRQWLQM